MNKDLSNTDQESKSTMSNKVLLPERYIIQEEHTFRNMKVRDSSDIEIGL